MPRARSSHGLASVRSLTTFVAALAAAASLTGAPAFAQPPCQVPDNGSGTVNLPPAGCGYVSPADLHEMINGLPAGTTIQVGAQHDRFFNVTRTPGGVLGGEVETFQSFLNLNLQGTGSLAGYSRMVSMQASVEVHTGPRPPGPVQTFPADMYGIQGQLPPGDPDFDLLRITAGSGFGMPSPGQTTLTQLPGGNWNVDSFFDITYRIDFIGSPGGPFAGMSGSTTATIRMKTGKKVEPPCQVPDNGSGTVNLPPAGCGYVSPDDLHEMINGLPPGTTIEVGAEHSRFFNVTTSPGGSLGGEIEQFQSFLFLDLSGTGGLAGYHRMIQIQAQAEVHTGPRTPGTAVQTFPNDMARLQGQLPPGDPDFDLLRITAGTDFGMPSPGHTTLTQLPGGNWNVDSFFDITYRIDFVGAAGGPLSGMSGSTTATIRMGTGQPVPPPCTVPDNGSGTIDLPPPGCGYVSPADLHRIIDGLPPGTTINVGAEHREFFNVTASPGGTLGGEVEQFQSFLQLNMEGTGDLAGFSRSIVMMAQCETHTAPRMPGDPVQSFDTDMFMLQGQLPPGDPDFDLLRITAGTGFGLPSPGHTTLTQQPGGSWAVDSFFDITYRIDFIGAPGGPLSGMSGSTTATIRMQTGQPAPPGCPPIPAGTDSFPSTAKLVIETLAVSSPPVVVRLSSAGLPDTVVQRGTHDQGLGTIPIEIISLDLSGSHPLIGGIQARLNPGVPSTGSINNVVQDPNSCQFAGGDSFFDVFAELTLPALGETWINTVPLRVQSPIRELPPRRSRYENPFVNPVVLYDSLTGQPRAQVLYEVHEVDPNFPPPGRDCLDTSLDLTLNVGGFPPQRVTARGPTMVDRRSPAYDGRCSDSGAPCNTTADCPLAVDTCVPIHTIDTEIVSMDLQGVHPFIGNFTVADANDPGMPSAGAATSQTPAGTYPADSFFDVFVEFDLPALGTTGHNQVPVSIQAGTPLGPGIRNIPPDPQMTRYLSPPGQQYPIVDPNGSFIGTIQDIDHRIGPPQDWQPPPPADEYCFDSWIVIRITIYNPFCSEEFMLPGSFRIVRSGPTDPGDGRDLMATLMAKALFTGPTTCVGDIRLKLRGSSVSGGEVRSLAPAENFPADSFFDVFVDADTAIGPLHTQDPSRMTTTINAVPPEPGEIYYGPGTVIPLYDASGIQIGEILEVDHVVHQRVQPCPADCYSLITFNRLDAPNVLHFGIADGGGMGLSHDLVRGDLRHLRLTGGFASAACMQNNGPNALFDPAMPPPGNGFFYVEREAAFDWQGSWNDHSTTQVGNRDPQIPLCN
jgi:hypothetical protein